MTAEEFVSADDKAPATEEMKNNWEDNLITDFLLTERPVNAVEDDEADEDDEPECPVKTAGDVPKWMWHLKHYFLNKGLTKNSFIRIGLERSDITSFFKKQINNVTNLYTCITLRCTCIILLLFLLCFQE